MLERDEVLSYLKKTGGNAYSTRTKVIFGLLASLIVVSGLAGYLCGYQIGSSGFKETWIEIDEPYIAKQPKDSTSKLQVFKTAAVCTDSTPCSDVGKKILANNGSAVDAAISSMFCNELLNHQSMGLGGGFFMTIYIRSEKQAYVVNAREKAPGNASADMYGGDSSKSSRGPLAVAVPGYLRGMWAAYKRWGKLPWEQLVAPTIDICNKGFVMSQVMYDGLNTAQMVNPIKDDINFRQMYVSESGKFYKPGSVVKPYKAICRTFENIALHGGDALYNGSLAGDFLDDLREAGTIITKQDLESYQPKVTTPLSVSLDNGETLYTPRPPSSGVILANILNILSGYRFNSSSISSSEASLTYHRIIEAFKYAYSTRTKLGDEDFLDVNELINTVTSPSYGASIRLRINDTQTSNDTATYGASKYMPPDSGTAHISIIAANGDAVSVTSSINFYFGAGFTTRRTGIVLNNVMDDFSSPGVTNIYGLEPSPANFIAPGKRPQSSMCPSVIVNKNGDVKMVVGGSGGTKITTSVALVTIRKLWFDQTVKQAVEAPRIHHQIFPMYVQYDSTVSEDIIRGLREKGHGAQQYPGRGSTVCALYKNETAIYGNADYRKGGDVSGMD